ncbi:MAG: hypothetical protein IJX47_07285 [Clostridia bacterium]|nr:hypothetical protein [Clostridia bacterium]
MTEKDLLTALSDVDEGYIEHAAASLEGSGRKRKSSVWWKSALLAACFAVMLGAAIPFAYRTGSHGTTTSPEPVDPMQNYEEIFLTADDIGSVFNNEYDGATNQYSTTYTLDPQYLPITPLSESEYYLIGHWGSDDVPLDPNVAWDFFSKCIEAFASATGISANPYALEENNILQPTYDVETEFGDMLRFSGSQTTISHNIHIYYDDDKNGLLLSGERVEVFQTQSDQEIIASLSNIREKLGNIFGESYADTKIVRYYDGYSSHGVSSLKVYFYNETDHPMNSFTNYPISNYICLTFDNRYPPDDVVGVNNKLTKFNIHYCQLRSELCEPIAKVKSISLTEAEQLLSQGYTFGGHSCPLCMAEQEAIDFADYDYVTMRYQVQSLSDSDSDEPRKVIPFYVFYKQIGTSQNGDLIYAYTYVPAVEVSGLEEYFQSQTQNHAG